MKAAFEEAATFPRSAILALQGLRRRSSPSINPGIALLLAPDHDSALAVAMAAVDRALGG